MLDHTYASSTTVEPNSTAQVGRAGTFTIIVPWLPKAQGGVNQVVINLYKEIARIGPYRPCSFCHDWNRHARRSGRWRRMPHCPDAYHGRRTTIALRYYGLSNICSGLARTLFRLWRLIVRYDIKVVNGTVSHPCAG